jgi:tetratricopeptide (TPR) repeat protein
VFGREPPFDKARALEKAEKAIAKGNYAQAIEEYRGVLAQARDDLTVLAKLAHVLAAQNQMAEALEAFRQAAEGHVRMGFVDRAISVYGQASTVFPKERSLWERIVELHVEEGRRADAVKVLLEARARLVRKDERPQALRCLERAFEIAPSVDVGVRLARLLAAADRAPEATRLLETLLETAEGKPRKVIRAAQLRITPSLGAFGRWLFSR